MMKDTTLHSTPLDSDRPDTRIDRVLRIIEAMTDDDLSPDLRVRMQQWFRGEGHDAEKLEAFLKVAVKLQPHKGPVPEGSIRRYNKLAARLGLPEIRTVPKKHRNLSLVGRIAAVVIPAAIILGAVLINRGAGETAVNIAQTLVTTPADSVKTVLLPDGSSVLLFEDSNISYAENFTADRSVALSGRARFNVTKIEGQPFTVTGRDITVTVLGTEFYMTATDSAPVREVSLLSGVVSISGGFDEVTITPGQQFTYDTYSHTTEIRNLSEGRILRLRDDGLELSARPLGELLLLLSEYYDVHIEIDPDVDTAPPIRLKLDVDVPLGEALGVARMASPTFDYSIDNGRVRVRKKR